MRPNLSSEIMKTVPEWKRRIVEEPERENRCVGY
jgi:hypothetical protein